MGPGLRPLVPPSDPLADPVALHRHGVELIAAANRLALAWMREATAQHAAITRKALADMTVCAREIAQAEGAEDQTQAVLAALTRAQDSGLDTARNIAGLMQRIQADSVALLRQALPEIDPPG